MRPVYLEFCGVNSFSERAEIDFCKLLEFGIFGIFGDTGAGKSTVLDCINFALYGAVGRARAGSKADIINYTADRAYVNFEFEIFYEGKRRTFRVEREIKRKNAVQAARIYERREGALSALTEGVRDSDALLEKIIGLEQRDFEKCIALPQGEFSQFVRSARSDRVKLVSRLFDLEKYGEELRARVTARYNEASLELKTVSARMEPYAEATEARLKELLAETQRLEKENAEATEALTRAREEEKTLTALHAKRREKEAVAETFKSLELRRGENEKLGAELSRLDGANAVVRCVEEGKRLRERAERAQGKLAEAKNRAKAAEEGYRALPAYDVEAADEEILRLTALKARAIGADDERKKLAGAKGALAEIIKQIEAQSAGLSDPRYAEERAAIERRTAELGQGDFFAFLEEHGRSALLRGEYAAFAEELRALTAKHPAISPDAAPLIEKYAALSEGERTTFADLKATFEARERAKEAAAKLLSELQTAQHRYELASQKIDQLRAEERRLEGEIKESAARLDGAPELAGADEALRAKQREKRDFLERQRRAQEELNSSALALAAAEEGEKAERQALEDARVRFSQALAAGKFESAQEAQTLVERYGDAAGARKRFEAFKEEYSATAERLKRLSAEDLSAATDEALEGARERLKRADELNLETARGLALARSEHARGKEALEKKRALEREFDAAKARAELCERLKKLLEGNKFMEYVAEEYLQTVAMNASGRLLSLTDGRYFLRYDGGFFVGDNFNGGALRAVYTLSGGETFLVSLSLALALSAEICAKSLKPIEFFFLDEGFGTLDERLVDTVMDSLEKLKGEHFSIGIISHVEALKNRIERKLTVKKATERHGSQIISE